MITRARSVAAGLSALAVLLLVVAGLPVVLFRFGGSPLPGHIASWHRIVGVLSSRDDSTVLLAVIRDCSWLAWLLFTVCVLAETQAVARGRVAPRLRLAGMQGAAARLVALAALAFTTPSVMTLSSSVSAVTSQQPMAGIELREMLATTVSAHKAAGSEQTLVVDAGAVTQLVTVRPGDCLWSIAQRYLGAGDRYPEIVSLNYGRDMGNGQFFTSPSLIEPGWHLALPADSNPGDGLALGATTHHLGHPTKDPRFRRRHRAASRRAAVPLAVDPAGNVSAGPGAASPPRADPGSAAGLSARETADQAGYRTPGDELPVAAAFVAGTLAGAALASLNRMRRRQRQQRRRGRRIALPADPDVLAAEQMLRATAPVTPIETVRDALTCLQEGMVGAGQELPDIVGLHVTPDVLEVLLSAPAAEAPPAPYVISPGRQGMCWQLDLPAAWDAASGGSSAAPAQANSHPPCQLLPGLLSVGATAGGYLLLDLEALQVTGCDGPPELVDRVIISSATELATGQWSGWYDLILVGCGELDVLGRGEHCATLGGALLMLESRAAWIAPRVTDRPAADLRALRLTEPGDEDWDLTILVSRKQPSPDEMTRLLSLAEDGPGGIAVLVAGDPESTDGRMAPTVLQLAPDPQVPDGIIANVVPLQITVRPRALTAADYEAITMLFTFAADVDDVGQDEAPYSGYGAPPWIAHASATDPDPYPTDQRWPDGEHPAAVPGLHRDGAGSSDGDRSDTPRYQPDGGPSADSSLPGGLPESEMTDCQLTSAFPSSPDQTPPAAVPAGHLVQQAPGGLPTGPRHAAAQRLEVKILGPLFVSGAAEVLQPKQAELMLALALAAPAGLSNSALSTMLGADPDHPKPTDAVRQIITRTRRRLGLAGDGHEFIIHTGNGQYVLHPDVSLDWSRFRALVASGRAEDLRAAVSLINGQPFTGSYFWWIDIPLLETVRAELVDAAEALAEFELATGFPRAAAKAARSGLLAEPSAEQLWRAVMRAEHAAGSLAGVAEAWRRCLDAIEDIAPGGEPHSDTVALYHQLTADVQHAPVR